MAKQENTVLAVDIGGGWLKMAEFGTTESGAIVLQRFAVKELSDREMDPVLSFAVAYNALLAENEFKAKAVNLSISGASSFSRLSKLPQLSGSSANVAKIVEFEASTVVPYDMNEVVWGYQLLKHTVQVEREIETVVGEDQSQPKVEVEDVDYEGGNSVHGVCCRRYRCTNEKSTVFITRRVGILNRFFDILNRDKAF